MAVNGIGTWTGLKAKKIVKAKKERPWTVFSSSSESFAQVRLQQRRPSGTLSVAGNFGEHVILAGFHFLRRY